MAALAYVSERLIESPEIAPSFEAIYEAHFDFVWRALRRLGVPEASTDDAVQDVFLVVHRRRASFEGRSSLKTWLYGIVLRVARDHRRKRDRKDRGVPLDQDLPDPSSGPAELAARNESLRLLDRILETLDEDKREVFVLAEVAELTAPEIAAMLELNLNTTYSRLRAARADFEAALERHRANEIQKEEA